MDKKKELENLLRNMDHTYDDFINGTLLDAEEYNAYDKLIDFIKSNPNVNSGDVVRFTTEELFGIKPFTDEEKQAYLDSLKSNE